MTPAHLDRSHWTAPARSPRIVHLGVGNFSRAHQAWYTAAADPAGEWGIAAFTGRSPAMAELLGRQDGLYTLIERGAQTDRFRVIDAVCEVHSGADVDRLIAAVAAPRTAVVTVTVTEAGYALGAADDAVPSVPRRLALGLHARRQAGAVPLAIVSCDNLHANGERLRELTLAAVDELSPAAHGWIADEVSFVSTSVDRITPPTGPDDRLLVRHAIDRLDDAPVVCEPFTDWVLCGAFPAGRPPWEDVGARFVADVAPWELRKLWLLNGGHCLLAYLGLLRGLSTVHDAAADRQLALALDRFWDLAQRHLPPAELDLAAYRTDLEQRFANGRIGYPLSQIAGDGLDKLRNRVVPIVEAAAAAGEDCEPALTVIAAWMRWLDDLPEVASVDAHADELDPILRSTSGPARTRALLELLKTGWGSRDALIDTTERLCTDLTAVTRG